jgi:hypothetical protein
LFALRCVRYAHLLRTIFGSVEPKIGGGGIRTPSNASNSSLHSTNKTPTKQTQKLAKTDTYKKRKNSNLNKTSTSSEQDHNKLLREKCAICVHQNFAANGNLPPELTKLIRLWPKLPRYIKMSVKALIEVFQKTKPEG